MVVEKLTQKTGAKVTYRDIGTTPIPHIDHLLVESYYKQGDLCPDAVAAGQRSKDLIDELMAHDTIVMGVPMYNFTIPSTLKAYIDHIARPGHTFNFTKNGYEGLVKNKRFIVVITRAGNLTGSLDNHQDTYLRTIFNFLGIDDYEFIVVEGLFDPHKREREIQNMNEKLELIAV
jgi:FMN-dependent NADH-azoreductase